MAIVEMKKMRLLALKKDGTKLLRRLQRLGCVQIVEGDSEDLRAMTGNPGEEAEELQKTMARLDWAIKKIAPYDPEKKGMFQGKPVKSEADAENALAGQAETMAMVARLEEIERRMGELRSAEARERSAIAQLTPWAGMDIPLEKLGSSRYARIEMLAVPVKTWEQFLAAGAEFSTPPVVEEISRDRENVHALCAVHSSDAASYEQAMKDAGAATVSFPHQQGTAAECIAAAEERIREVGKENKTLNKEIEAFGARTGEAKLLWDVLNLALARESATAKFAQTGSAFLLTAWTPADREGDVRAAVERTTKDYDISFDDPAEDEEPPVALRNGKVIKPFESIVKMYSMPSYRGLDPTCVMMPFFICYFGLMVSDAAYGIILAILGGLLWKKLHGKGAMGAISFVVAMGGLATVFWGAMLGGWFGIEDVPAIIGFTPMSEPLKMMVLCLALGAVQILTGLGVAVYMNLRRGKPLDALFDQGFWLIIFAGIGLLFVNGKIGLILMAVGALGIVCFGGRQKKGFGRILSGLGKLYDITSYMSDILSYARLFGMGLATGVIAMVMNNVAMMLWGGVGTIFAIAVLIVGHVFNIGINALGAYVHSCRLQYIEFFGKFYEDGGTAFMPMDTTGKYVEFESGDASKAA